MEVAPNQVEHTTVQNRCDSMRCVRRSL